MRGRARRSCAVVRGRARSCAVVRGRAWSCAAVVVMRGGRAWSCAAAVRGRARRSCVVVTHCRSARFAASTAVLPASRPALPWRTDGRTHGRTTYNTPLNPPGVGWVNFFYPIKVRVSIRTCVPNLGSIRGSVRNNCLLSLIIDLTYYQRCKTTGSGRREQYKLKKGNNNTYRVRTVIRKSNSSISQDGYDTISRIFLMRYITQA